jgi:RNA ligase partner protein
MKKALVLDTSVFVNPDSGRFFGTDPTSSFQSFLELAQAAASVEIMMPPSVYEELMHFAEEAKIPKKLLLAVHRKPPRKHEIKVPGVFLYQLVEEIRDRTDRGLRLAERVARESIQMTPPPAAAPGQKGPRADAEVIARLRESYRRIMREGMLDSRADVDMLLLAYETGATLVSADVGVLVWAENLGISMLDFKHLRDFLLEHAGKALS